MNVAWGGFRLSPRAIERLHELGIHKWDSCIIHSFEGEELLIAPDEARTDSELVRVVEELGAAANGDYAKLKVVDLPGGDGWEEYEGLETREVQARLEEAARIPEVYEPVIITRSEVVEIHPEARIDSFVKIEGGQGVKIGRWVHIASFCHINVGGGEVILEEGSACASGAKIGGGSNLISGVSCSAKAPKEMQHVKRSKTVIGKNAVVFMNAVVTAGVTVGEGAVIAAGAVVIHDIPAYEVWGGVPARKIGERR